MVLTSTFLASSVALWWWQVVMGCIEVTPTIRQDQGRQLVDAIEAWRHELTLCSRHYAGQAAPCKPLEIKEFVEVCKGVKVVEVLLLL